MSKLAMAPNPGASIAMYNANNTHNTNDNQSWYCGYPYSYPEQPNYPPDNMQLPQFVNNQEYATPNYGVENYHHLYNPQLNNNYLPSSSNNDMQGYPDYYLARGNEHRGPMDVNSYKHGYNKYANIRQNMRCHRTGYGPMETDISVESCYQSSNRESRNNAEKRRRENINRNIREIGVLTPTVSKDKKADKTSILRLAVTHLCLHHKVIPGTRIIEDPLVQKVNFSNYLDDLGCMLICVNGSGKIIFISESVQKYLGYEPNEMFGHSLKNFTLKDDHAELEKQLKPTELNSSVYSQSSDNSTADSDAPSTSTSSPNIPIPNNVNNDGSNYELERSFYLSLMHRTSRNDQPRYEFVHFFGHLRVPAKKASASPSSRRGKPYADRPISDYDIILVATIKPCDKLVVKETIILQANDEYFSRHFVDGRIIGTDHRISLVSGHFSHEVIGKYGFSFMAKDDFWFTITNLKLMYCSTSNTFGSSCYKIKSKSGRFVYIRSTGFLETNHADTQTVLCVNKLLTDEEGKKINLEMKNKLYPIVKCIPESLRLNMTEFTQTLKYDNLDLGETVDEELIQKAALAMIENVIPNESSANLDATDAADNQCKKLSLYSKIITEEKKPATPAPVLKIKKDETTPPPEQLKSPRHISVIRHSSSRLSESDSDKLYPVKRMKTTSGSVSVDGDFVPFQHTGVLVSHRTNSKRHHSLDENCIPKPVSPIYSQAQPVPLESPILPPPTATITKLPAPDPIFGNPEDNILTPSFVTSILSTQDFQSGELVQLVDSYDPDNSSQMEPRLLTQLGSDPLGGYSQTNELFRVSTGLHEQLETTLQSQQIQMREIHENLQQGFENVETDVYRSNLTKLMAHQQELEYCYEEHQDQHKELERLRQDSLNVELNDI